MITETPGIILVTDIEKVFIEGAMISTDRLTRLTEQVNVTWTINRSTKRKLKRNIIETYFDRFFGVFSV